MAKKSDFEVTQHPFDPGEKVAVHPAQQTEVERNEGRFPISKADDEVTVGKDGKLEVSAEPGTYSLSNVPKKDDEDPQAKWLLITVK